MAFNMLRSFVWGTPVAQTDSGAGINCAECKACVNVNPGSVTPHNQHVLVRLPPPPGGASIPTHLSWPQKVDDHPAIVAVNDAIKQSREALSGPVKVTAFEYSTPPSTNQSYPDTETYDVLIFPAAVKLVDVSIDDLGSAVVKSLTAVRTSGLKTENSYEIKLPDLNLIVCCHAARDSRCGYLGPLLADKLAQCGGNTVNVFLSSHIGGHQYAGNVISYGSKQPSAGTWFGGLDAEQAQEFLDALRALPLSGDPARDVVLRKWWRGRVGLTKQEQITHFARAGRDIEDLIK